MAPRQFGLEQVREQLLFREAGCAQCEVAVLSISLRWFSYSSLVTNLRTQETKAGGLCQDQSRHQRCFIKCQIVGMMARPSRVGGNGARKIAERPSNVPSGASTATESQF
jgi:hypothetical protein